MLSVVFVRWFSLFHARCCKSTGAACVWNLGPGTTAAFGRVSEIKQICFPQKETAEHECKETT